MPASPDEQALAGLPTSVGANKRVEAKQWLSLFQAPHLSAGVFASTNAALPPNWVKVGTRLTYYVAAATVVSRGTPTCWPDPNGEYTDQQGNKMSCSGMPWDPEGSIAGAGLEQVDVLEVGNAGAIVQQTLLSISPGNSDYMIVPMGAVRITGDTVGNMWIHPRLLANMSVNNPTGLKPYTSVQEIEGTTYNLVSFVNTVSGSYESHAYDRDTGLLVASSINKAATPRPSGGNNANLSVMRLRGVRQRNIPGITGTNPSWVATGKQMMYSGTMTFATGGGGDFVQPTNYTVQLGQKGKNWCLYTGTMVINWGGQNQTTNGSAITTSAGIFWIDPRALPDLRQGKVLDQDPQSGERMTVASVQGSGSSKLVTISLEIPGNRFLLTYDASNGALTRYYKWESISNSTLDLQLQGLSR